MSLVQLIYTSESITFLSKEEVQDIINKATKNNNVKKITGVLIYDVNYFLQCLEGPTEEVNALYLKVSQDDRHKNIQLISYNVIKSRSFADWEMGLILPSPKYSRIYLKYGASDTFMPYALTSENCLDFLKEISEKAISLGQD